MTICVSPFAFRLNSYCLFSSRASVAHESGFLHEHAVYPHVPRDEASKETFHPLHAAQSFHAALLHPSHHLAGHLELLQKLIDLLDGSAAPLRDTLAAAALDDVGVAPLFHGHGLDDDLCAHELVLVDVLSLDLARHAGEHLHHVADAAHLLDALELFEIILKGEGALLDLLLQVLRLFFGERLLRLFDEREHVSHAEDAARHAFGLVSKGTYIRSLIRDIGAVLGVGATMTSLRRIRQGKFTIDESSSLDDILNDKYSLLQLEDVLDLVIVECDRELTKKVTNGVKVPFNTNKDFLLFRYGEKNLALYKRDGDIFRMFLKLD